MHKPSYHYREFGLKKADGSERVISTPKTYLKVVQWWILDNILAHQSLNDCVHGFRSGRSYVTNAQMHEKSRHVLNVDIKSFFDNINSIQVTKVFQSLGYSESGRSVLTSLTTKDGVAPTGAPTSPMIANLIFRNADDALEDLASKCDLIYTRYADDLTFSAQTKIPREVVNLIAQVVKEAGFELNPKKTKFMGPGDRQDVTGVVINSGLSAPKEWRNWARGYLHKVRMNPKQFADETARVRGVFGTIRQFDPDKTSSLARAASKTLEMLQDVRKDR